MEGSDTDLIYGIIPTYRLRKTVENLNATKKKKKQILKLPHSPLRLRIRVRVVHYEIVKCKQSWVRTALSIKAYHLTGHRTVNSNQERTFLGFKTE